MWLETVKNILTWNILWDRLIRTQPNNMHLVFHSFVTVSGECIRVRACRLHWCHRNIKALVFKAAANRQPQQLYRCLIEYRNTGGSLCLEGDFSSRFLRCLRKEPRNYNNYKRWQLRCVATWGAPRRRSSSRLVGRSKNSLGSSCKNVQFIEWS